MICWVLVKMANLIILIFLAEIRTQGRTYSLRFLQTPKSGHLFEGANVRPEPLFKDLHPNILPLVWAKVKSAASKINAKVREDVLKILKEYKGKVIADLKNLGQTIISAGKEIIVVINKDLVEVIVGDQVAESSDVAYGFRDSEYTFEVLY